MRPRTSKNLRGPACSLCDIIQFGYFHQISLLVSKGIDVGARDALGRTPLILCAFMQPQEWGVGAAMTLIERGVYVGERDCLGRNVLHYACIYERQKLVRVLLRAIDFDLNQADTLGNTPLHYAAMSGNVAITNLLVQSFRKYRIKASRVNRDGKTALAEAVCCGNAASARAIEMGLTSDQPGNTIKDVHFTDGLAMGSHLDHVTTQNGPAVEDSTLPRSTWAAIVGRRQSSSSINFVREGRSLVCSGSSSIEVRSGRARKSPNPLYARGYRRDADIISCAPDGDFRNTPDYVCKLVRLPSDAILWGHVTATHLANGNTAREDTSSMCQRQQNGTGWRQELEQLFKVYEHQCSASWRASQQLDQLGAAAPTSTAGTEDEDKGKKGRNCTSAARAAHWKDSSPEPRKRLASVRSRKIANGKHAGGPTADGSLDTSCESITSLVSTKRKGLEKDNSLGRPESSVAKQRVKSAKGRNSQTQSPITFTASSPLPTSTSSKTNPGTGNTVTQLVNTKENLTPSSNNTTNHGTTAAVYLPTLSAASAPSTGPAQKITTVDTSSATRQDSNQLASLNSAGKDAAATTLPKITVVTEKHTAGERQSPRSSKPQEQVDTNKLWVQNPYESNNNQAEEDNDNNN